MTVEGKHDPAEVRELLTQKTKDVAAMAKAFSEFEPLWSTTDSVSATDYRFDLEALITRWNATKNSVVSTLESTSGAPEKIKLIASEQAWQDILKSLQRAPGSFQKGDFPDLAQRLFRAGKTWTSPVKQPTAPDHDLDLYKQADALTKTLENKALPAAYWIGGGLVAIWLFGQFLRGKE